MTWIVSIKGERMSIGWEISVVKKGDHGETSYGWFGPNKYLVGHDGGPCQVPACGFIWDRLIVLAHELCDALNSGVDVEAPEHKRQQGEDE